MTTTRGAVSHGPMQNGDRLIQGMAGGGDFRIIAAQTTETVEAARAILDLAPVAADALGRALTGALMLARLLEKSVKNQSVTLRFEGEGPLGTLIAEANVAGGARGWVENPVPATDLSLDVRHAVGGGMLTIIRGTPPLGRPYTSQVPLLGSGVAEELTHYLLRSEQIPSAVLLGVFNRREGVAAAGGMIVQAFPHAGEESIALIERRIREAPPLSTLLEKLPIEDVVATVLHGCDYKQIDASFNIPLSYRCTCTRTRALAPLALLPKKDLEEMIEEGGTVITCQFCGRKYEVDAESLIGGR
jgi:molecular chaperone Hsp33